MNFKSFLTITPLSGDTLSSDKKTVVELKNGPNRIGSSLDCDVVLSPDIPSHLCMVTIDSSDRYIIRNLDQSLGIYTEENNERLNPNMDHVFSIDKSFYIGNLYKCVVELAADDNKIRSPSESGLVLSGEEELYPSTSPQANFKNEVHGTGMPISSTLILPTPAPDEYSDFPFNIHTQLTDKDRLRIKEEEFKATQVVPSEDEGFGKADQVPARLTNGDEKNVDIIEEEEDSSQDLDAPPKEEKNSREKRIEFLRRQSTTPDKDDENEETLKDNSNQKSLERSDSRPNKAVPVHYTREKYQDNDDNNSIGFKNDDEQKSPGKRKFVKNFRKSFEKKMTGEINTEIEIENEDKEKKAAKEETEMDIEQQEEEKKDEVEQNEESKMADQENQNNKKGKRVTRGRNSTIKETMEQPVPVKRETRSAANKKSTSTSTKNQPQAKKKPKHKKATQAKSVAPSAGKSSRSSSRKSQSKSKSQSNTRGKKQKRQTSKGGIAKTQGERSSGRKQARSSSQNLKSLRNKSSHKALSQSKKSSLLRRQSTDLVRQAYTQQTQSKKRKREESNSARTSIVKELARQDNLKRSKKNEHKPSSKSTERVTIKKVQDSKKKGPAKDKDLFKKNLYQVTFSGLDPTQKDVEDNKKKIAKLGIKLVEEPSEKFNVVVMDKFKRTLKFLIGLNEGAHIVDYEWIKDSIKQNKVLDLTDYLYENASMEAQYNFNLNETLEKARKAEDGLLEGYKVYVGKNVKPSQDELRILVQSMGGNVLKRTPTENRNDVIAIVNEADNETLQEARQIGFKAYTPEFVFSAVMHRQLDFKSFFLK